MVSLFSDIETVQPAFSDYEPDELRDPILPVETSQTDETTVPLSTDTAKAAIPDETNTIDFDILQLLGDDPTVINTYGKEIQKDIAVRLEHYATTGLTKEARKVLKEKYLTPSNCKLIDPPVLNGEIKAAVSDTMTRRDKSIEEGQKDLTVAIACLSEVLSNLISTKDKDMKMVKTLMDACKILCDCQHAHSKTRKQFILTALKTEMKSQLQNTKIDQYLFSENLADTLKSAKAINKSGAELKSSQVPKPQPSKKPAPAKRLNWKGPLPPRRQQGVQRTKELATTSMKNRPGPSSKPSSYRQPNQQYHRR